MSLLVVANIDRCDVHGWQEQSNSNPRYILCAATEGQAYGLVIVFFLIVKYQKHRFLQ